MALWKALCLMALHLICSGTRSQSKSISCVCLFLNNRHGWVGVNIPNICQLTWLTGCFLLFLTSEFVLWSNLSTEMLNCVAVVHCVADYLSCIKVSLNSAYVLTLGHRTSFSALIGAGQRATWREVNNYTYISKLPHTHAHSLSLSLTYAQLQ